MLESSQLAMTGRSLPRLDALVLRDEKTKIVLRLPTILYLCHDLMHNITAPQ